ncbi:zinc finger, CCHC-type containing protein [Tanacetum coccineum]
MVLDKVSDEVVIQQPELRKRKKKRTPKSFGPEFQLYLIEGKRDEQTPKQWHQKFDKMVLSSGYLLNQANKCVYSKFDKSGKGVIICLYVDDMLIFGTDQDQLDLRNEFLSSRFSMKDMREADVILMSTLIDTSKKLRPNNGQGVSQLEYSRVIGCLMYAMTCLRPDLLCGRETDASTLAKAYSQMYNGKSRHLGVRHNMIRELIMNWVISIELVRSQQNLVDHWVKGLARDLVIKSWIQCGKFNDQWTGAHVLHIISRMCSDLLKDADGSESTLHIALCQTLLPITKKIIDFTQNDSKPLNEVPLIGVQLVYSYLNSSKTLQASIHARNRDVTQT